MGLRDLRVLIHDTTAVRQATPSKRTQHGSPSYVEASLCRAIRLLAVIQMDAKRGHTRQDLDRRLNVNNASLRHHGPNQIVNFLVRQHARYGHKPVFCHPFCNPVREDH